MFRLPIAAIILAAIVTTALLASTSTDAEDSVCSSIASLFASELSSTSVLTHTAYLPFVSSYCLPFPLPSPQPSFFWATCFNSLDEVQNFHLGYQGRYSLVNDPTGTGRGQVLKCDAAPDLAYFDPQYTPNGRTVVRSYPTMYFPQEIGAHVTGLDVYVVNDFSPGIQSTSDGPHLSLLSDFYDTMFGAGWIIGVKPLAIRYRS